MSTFALPKYTGAYMKVLKFGGTSVGTAESLTYVKHIVESGEDRMVVVVSALGGLTDKLLATAALASSGDQRYKDNMLSIADRHRGIITAIIAPEFQDEVSSTVESMLEELGKLYDGVALIGELPDQTLDRIVSFGERMSSVIVSRMIPGATHFNSLDIIKTEKWFNKNIADTVLTDRNIKETLGLCKSKVAVIGGFISTDRDSGEITNLGRGGSDYTAALVAAALDADCLEIWTDVDGFMTADPRIIPQAQVIDRLSFVESMELCSFGAKVVYPPTIYPVFHKNIPIRILNTFRSTAPGTWITDKAANLGEAKGVTSVRKISIIEIEGKSAENVPEINSRTFNSLAKSGISVKLVSQPTADSSFSFAVSTSDSQRSAKALEQEFAPDMETGEISRIQATDGMAIIAIVGENIGHESGTGPRILNSLQRAGISVAASSHGASAMSHAYVVAETDADNALRIIHETFFEKS